MGLAEASPQKSSVVSISGILGKLLLKQAFHPLGTYSLVLQNPEMS